MGVDISTYRCRVGRFVPHRGTGVICLPMNFSQLTKIIGAVSFVRILLVIAGIEQNPGPQDKYVFRYMYLLIEIGTKVLRETFEVQVHYDFAAYLTTNSTASQTLTSLMTGRNRKITSDQEKLLPPQVKQPTSSMYDITLLTCLLRNICGLRPAGDQVWINPLPTDHSIEADITRLRKCRNDIMHIDTLRKSEKELNDKWQELVEILHRLNNTAGIGNLSKLINDAEFLDIDAELKQRYLETIKAWVTMDCSLDKIQEDVAGLKRGQSDIQGDVAGLKLGQSNIHGDVAGLKRGQSDIQGDVAGLKRGQSDIQGDIAVLNRGQSDIQGDVAGLKFDQSVIYSRLDDVEMQPNVKRPRFVDFKDIQKYLVDIYQHCCKKLPVSPLFKHKGDNLLTLYKYPLMYSVKCNGEQNKGEKEIKCYEDIFCNDGCELEEIYIVGDAGVGKTSFCTCMSFLWCYTKSENKLGDKYKVLQKDVEYLSKFEFVFFVRLRDTCHTRVEDMIIEQLFRDDKATYQNIIDTILREKTTLILMDGLDEWVPTQVAGKKTYELPDRIYSNNCVYITTSRPHRIECVDNQVEIRGIGGESSKSYVEEVIKFMNKENSQNRIFSDFVSDINKCKLDDLLCIPIIASHLVVLWFEQPLADMPRALIYAYILELLFKRAEKKGVVIPSSTESKFQHLPDSLSGLKYLSKHVSLLYNVCHLSFRSLFKQDEDASNLVFTIEQLQDEPYCFTDAETDLLCKIGIVSENEVFGCYSVEKLKVSFIHKSYIEFFAALFISSSDISQLFETRLTSLDYVLQYENLILLLVGFFPEGGKVLFDKLYQSMSDDLSLCRRKALFDDSYQIKIKLLQNVVIKCFKEVSRTNNLNVELKLEDFIFDKDVNDDILRQLLLSNTACVKSIYVEKCKYFDEFDQINTLQCLHVDKVLSIYYDEFFNCMLKNKSTLHTVGITGRGALISEFPLITLQHLTSLSLETVKMQHDSLHNLEKFLSDTVLIENIKLSYIRCHTHKDCDGDCSLTLNLQHHTQLTSLYLWDVKMSCNNVNTSSLKFITLCPHSENIFSCYIDLFSCIKDSQLEHLFIYGNGMLDNNSMKTLASSVKTLPYIKSLSLNNINLPDDGLLQLHPDVSQVEIELWPITMSRQCFHSFIESFGNNKSVIKVKIGQCNITSTDGETRRVLSEKDSVVYISEYLTSIRTVKFTRKHARYLHFQTSSCL